VKLLSYSFI